ncbi:hypothetical protein AVEN_35241-1 [Araneus ventricosus]|uniref:Uncharacterized protein n=1 Tax=Araneus ventricosus TaxID=182803 RepID=A0A4Y2UUT6_ARAVE|nr:hypothetical protein AVEN_35241-1 [Araneus ventricosus]
MDLLTALQDSRCEFPPGYLQTPVESMPRRFASLLRAHGGPTRYYKGVPVFLALRCIMGDQSGTIDYLETAKIAITEELSDILNLHKLACLNCLEDDITRIWKKIPTDIKIRFKSNNDPIALKQDRVLVVFWNLLNLPVDEAEEANRVATASHGELPRLPSREGMKRQKLKGRKKTKGDKTLGYLGVVNPVTSEDVPLRGKDENEELSFDNKDEETMLEKQTQEDENMKLKKKKLKKFNSEIC